MKAGVLTFHNTSNYGAALQAHGTIAALESLGVDAEVIDYANEVRRSSYNVGFRLKRSFLSGDFARFLKELITFPGIFLRNASFKKFYRKYLSSSDVEITSHDHLKEYVKKYDFIIAGSDQIWSYKNNAGDLSYLLDFTPSDAKTLSYASSFGMAEIPESVKNEYSSLLKRIKYISVREKEGQKLVHDLTGRRAEVVVDPVLLHDAEYWRKFLSESAPKDKDFDFYYVNDVRYLGYVLNFKDNVKKLPIVSMGSFSMSKIFDCRFSIKNGHGPGSFLTYLYWSRCVFTSSYHAVLFCLIFKKPFYVFLSGDEGRDSRILHVLKIYGLMDRAISHRNKDVPVCLNMNFGFFDEIYPVQKSESYKFLRDALGCDADT
jgi:hypothetical protein